MRLTKGSLIGSLAFGLLLAFSGLATTSCASGGDKDKGDEMADEGDKTEKKNKKGKKGKKGKKKAKPESDAPAE